jgi:hypothetical protein
MSGSMEGKKHILAAGKRTTGYWSNSPKNSNPLHNRFLKRNKFQDFFQMYGKGLIFEV